MDPAGSVSIVTELITNLGFPIALCLGLGWFLYKLVNKMLLGHEQLIKEYQNQLKSSQIIITNHQAHQQTSLEKISECLTRHDGSLEKFADKIVNSIEKQTDLIRDINTKGNK